MRANKTIVLFVSSFAVAAIASAAALSQGSSSGCNPDGCQSNDPLAHICWSGTDVCAYDCIVRNHMYVKSAGKGKEICTGNDCTNYLCKETQYTDSTCTEPVGLTSETLGGCAY